MRRAFGQSSAVQPLPADAAALVLVEQDGTRLYKQQVHDRILQMLSQMSVIPIDATNVKLDVTASGDTRQSATSWMQDALAAGQTVLFGSPQGLVAAVSPLQGVDRVLKSVPDHAAEIDYVGPNTSPTFAVLDRPGAYQTAALGPVGISLLALAVGGALYFGYEALRKGSSS